MRFEYRRILLLCSEQSVSVGFSPAKVVQGMFYICFTEVSVSTDQKGIWEMCAPADWFWV